MSYVSNSDSKKRRPKEEREAVVPVAKGRRVAKKGLSKLANNLGEDVGQSIVGYIMDEYVMPNAMSTAYDAVEGLASLIFLKGNRSNRRRSSSSNIRRMGQSTDTRYDQMDRRSRRRSKASPERRPGRYNYEIITVDDRGSAELVLDTLQEYMEKYEAVTVLDYYDACGVDPSSHMDSEYGWVNLDDAYIRRVGNGEYEIVMPDNIIQLNK